MADFTDEQLLEMDDDDFEQAQGLSENVDVEDIEEVVEEQIDEVPDEDDTVAEVAEDSEETAEDDEDAEVSETEDESLADTEEVEESDEEESPDAEEGVEESKDFNYETSYNELMKPLNVSGKETQVKSISDMRNLASMGMDYSRKMRDIKPLRAIGETLSQAGIMVDGVVDEAALTRLIDINNGNKDAITQMLAERNIDPLDLETDNVNYVPAASMVTEQAIAVQDVEKELMSRGSIDSVISELDKLDVQSKQFFNESPADLLKLDDDIKSGVYAQVMGTVHYERSLGRLSGKSDMQAYIELVSQNTVAPTKVVPAAPATRPSVAKRKAGGITKRAPAQKTVQTYDYVNMSDEDFEKLTPQMSLY